MNQTCSIIDETNLLTNNNSSTKPTNNKMKIEDCEQTQKQDETDIQQTTTNNHFDETDNNLKQSIHQKSSFDNNNGSTLLNNPPSPMTNGFDGGGGGGCGSPSHNNESNGNCGQENDDLKISINTNGTTVKFSKDNLNNNETDSDLDPGQQQDTTDSDLDSGQAKSTKNDCNETLNESNNSETSSETCSTNNDSLQSSMNSTASQQAPAPQPPTTQPPPQSVQTTTPPFPLLAGEHLKHEEITQEYAIYLTNYRLYGKLINNNDNEDYILKTTIHQQQQDQLFCLPINNIDSVEIRDLYFLTIYTKYIESFVITFQSAESASIWHKRLSDIQDGEIEHLFCFDFYKNLELLTANNNSTSNNHQNHDDEDNNNKYLNKLGDLISINKMLNNKMYQKSKTWIFDEEFNRMKFDRKYWRISDINQDFSFCQSYPRHFIVPNEMTDKDLECVANFRYSRRIPAVVWRNQKNGCVILRSSQPVVGWLGGRNSQDERMFQVILKICMKDTHKYHNKHIYNNTHNNMDSKNTSTLNGTTTNHNYHPQQESNGVCCNGIQQQPDSEESIPKTNECTVTPTTTNNNNQPPITNGQMNGTANGQISTLNKMSNGQQQHMNHSIEKLDDETNRQTSMNNKLLILDARSYTAAFANRAMGGGCECPEYYTSCDVQFMGLNNIHSIRKSFYALRYICESSQIDQSNWFTLMDNTKWLHNLASLLKAAVVVVDAISIQERPVLVHCSDGWDRTPQVIALAELMLDPYYRTIDGFRVLIEKEWLQFGHKFADRCRSSTLNIDPNERCPVFLQWVDCVHQLIKQFPNEFEFNVFYLMKLVYHSYSCLFGTFTCNNVQERVTHEVYDKTISLWSYFELNKNCFVNYLYLPKQEILRPSCRVKDINFWNEIYVPVSNNVSNSVTNIISCNGICAGSNNSNDHSEQDLNPDKNHNNNNGMEFNCIHDIPCQSQSKCELNRSASYENNYDLTNSSSATGNIEQSPNAVTSTTTHHHNQHCEYRLAKFNSIANAINIQRSSSDSSLLIDKMINGGYLFSPNVQNGVHHHNHQTTAMVDNFDNNFINKSRKSPDDKTTTKSSDEDDDNNEISMIHSNQQQQQTLQVINKCFSNNGETMFMDCLADNQTIQCNDCFTMFDVDGQFIGKDNNKILQLERLINYHKRMLRCLTNRLKNEKNY